MPFDIGRFLETGGKYMYDILSEQKKYKNKMDEIEAKIRAEGEEAERKRQDNFVEAGMDFIENIITSGKFNPETNRAIYQSGLEMGLPLPILPGMEIAPTPTGIPTRAGAVMPGGVAGMEGLPPLRPEDVAGAGALFEAPAVEPKPPTVAERKLGMDAVSVAALINQGVRTQRSRLGGEVRINLTSREDAINFAGEMGWTADTPEYKQHIAPAIERWFGRYSVDEVNRMKTDRAIRKRVRKILRESDRDDSPENIDIFIERNWQRLR